MGGAVGGPHGADEHPGLPAGDGVLVELDENALTAVLGSRHPGRAAGTDQGDEPGLGVLDPVVVVHASEPEDGVDLAQAVDGEHPAHPGRHVPEAAWRDNEPTVTVLVVIAGWLGEEIVPFGHEEVHRIPALTTFEAVDFTLSRSVECLQQLEQFLIAQVAECSSLGTSRFQPHSEEISICSDLFPPTSDTASENLHPVPGDLGGVQARHVDNGLGGGEPEVGGAHEHDAGFGLAASLGEDPQVGVAAAAAREPLAPVLPLGLGHSSAGSAGAAGDEGGGPSLGGVTHGELGVGCLGAVGALVDPPVVGELIEVPARADDEVAGGHAR